MWKYDNLGSRRWLEWKGGNLVRPVVWILLSIPLFSEIRMLLSSRSRGAPSHVRVSGKKGWGRGSEWPSCICFFLKVLQLKIFNMPRCHALGYCVLNSIIDTSPEAERDSFTLTDLFLKPGCPSQKSVPGLPLRARGHGDWHALSLTSLRLEKWHYHNGLWPCNILFLWFGRSTTQSCLSLRKRSVYVRMKACG